MTIDNSSMCEASATVLYRIYDAFDRLLYVGISDGPFVRLVAHSKADWSAYAARITLERCDDRKTAAAAELRAIRGEDPVFNIDGRPYKRYAQWMRAYPDRHADDIDPSTVAQHGRRPPSTTDSAIVELDPRGHISITNRLRNPRDRYLIHEAENGTITLTPAVVLSELDLSYRNDRELQGIVEAGIANSRRRVRREPPGRIGHKQRKNATS